jgi:hypothetical protein
VARDTLKYRVEGSSYRVAEKAALRLAAHHQTEGKIVRCYTDPKMLPEQLPSDADVIILVDMEKPKK